MTDIKILSDHRCHLGEGPFYCEQRDTLFWFDILDRKRHAYNFREMVRSALDLTEMSSAMGVVDDRHDALFTSSGLWLLDIEKQERSPIVSIEADNPLTRSNDARIHPSGAFWMGTVGLSAEKNAGAIYHYRKGTLTTLLENITIPNGICFAPDGRTAYFTDTVTEKLLKVSVDPDTGLPEAEPEILIDHSDNPGGLDGAIVDAEGNIWIALWGASCVNNYSADGELLNSIAVPALQSSCPAFLGNGKIAVTSAWEGMDEKVKMADKHAGMTFVIDVSVLPKYEPRLLI